MDTKPISIMVVGLDSGQIARELAAKIVEGSKFYLVPYSISSENTVEKSVIIAGIKVTFVRPSLRDMSMVVIKKAASPFIVADFSLPSLGRSNAGFYCKNSLPFVLGATGGNKSLIRKAVLDSKINAITGVRATNPTIALNALTFLHDSIGKGIGGLMFHVDKDSNIVYG